MSAYVDGCCESWGWRLGYLRVVMGFQLKETGRGNSLRPQIDRGEQRQTLETRLVTDLVCTIEVSVNVNVDAYFLR